MDADSFLKVDWQLVADKFGISNGHAARMRFSRLKQQMEGTPTISRRARRAAPSSKKPKQTKRSLHATTGEDSSKIRQSPMRSESELRSAQWSSLSGQECLIEAEAGAEEAGETIEPVKGVEPSLNAKPIMKPDPDAAIGISQFVKPELVVKKEHEDNEESQPLVIDKMDIEEPTSQLYQPPLASDLNPASASPSTGLSAPAFDTLIKKIRASARSTVSSRSPSIAHVTKPALMTASSTTEPLASPIVVEEPQPEPHCLSSLDLLSVKPEPSIEIEPRLES